MKCIIFMACVLGNVTFLPMHASAQAEEIRHETGLPIPIGQPVIFGQVTVRGLARNEPKPTIYVTLYLSGIQVDRKRTIDNGYYYFLASPRDGSLLVFEVNDAEVGRVPLTASVGSSVRRDIEVDLRTGQANKAAPGVVSVRSAYARSAENDKIFDKAMAAAREKRSADATKLLKQIADADPKDFVAWTELGTLYFGSGKLVDAEISYTRALELKPDFMIALMNLGKLQLAQKQPEKAVYTFTRAANVQTSSADAFHYLGESYLQMKLGSKAVVAMNEAIRLSPMEKADLHLRLAVLYDAAGVKDRAAAEYKIFLGKKPDFPEREKLEKYIRENSK